MKSNHAILEGNLSSAAIHAAIKKKYKNRLSKRSGFYAATLAVFDLALMQRVQALTRFPSSLRVH